MTKQMTKFFGVLAAAFMAVALSSPARADAGFDAAALQNATMLDAGLRQGLNWHVGDKASYSLNIGGFIKGTSDNLVREDTGTSFWMVQDMNLMIQKQKVEALINKSTGQIEKLLVNGQEQSVPKVDQQILEMHEDHVTVAAGTFDCIYAKIQDKSNQQITEAWINPKAIPMSGVLKAIADSQLGKVNQELTSFSFATPPAPPAP
jgi:hypothetical protein